MRNRWVALLSMLGMTGSVVQIRAQGNGTPTQDKTVHNTNRKAVNGNKTGQSTGGSSKLTLNQQTLRQQNEKKGGGKQADTVTPSAYCNKGNKGTGKADNAVTKGNANTAVTKGNANTAITKGNANTAVTKGGNSQLVTKGNAAQTAAAGAPK